MRPAILIAVASMLIAACASSTSETRRPGRDRTTISAAELQRTAHTDLYSAIASLRPTWLSRRGPSSIHFEGELIVYHDRTRLGGPEMLSTIDVTRVMSVRFLTPSEAQARFGMGHPHGAIIVSTDG